MRAVRKAVFWLHLAIGLTAGAIVLLMSVTGVLMSFERQITGLADGFKITAAPGAVPLGPERLLEKLHAAPSAVGFERDPAKPVIYQYGREKTLFADPYSGESLGSGNTAVRGFFKSVLSWHRFLGREGASQSTGKAVIGIGNLMFLFLLVSGIILWFPRRWTRNGLQAITLIRTRLKGRARDWNLHNAFGVWAAVPLLVIVTCGAVISQPWANDLVFLFSGEKPPPRAERKKPGPVEMPADLTGLDAALASVKAANPGWQTIQLQLPFGKTATFTVADSHRGRPDLSRKVTVDRTSAAIVKAESFGDLGPGRRARTWIRWIHTGEAGGLAGQSIAGLAAASSAVLVWTGFALSWRRFTRRKTA